MDRNASWRRDAIVGGYYRVVRRIGLGGMASVFLAREGDDGRHVAIKVPIGNWANDGRLRRQFDSEARLWLDLGAHPCILRAFDVREIDRIPCIFMEYASAGSLADELATSRSGLPLGRALAIALDIAWGMTYAHCRGVLHRDIKPSNILLNADDGAKIADFGLAKKVGGAMDSFDLVGTAGYIAPELWRGEKATPQSDIYSFGVVLSELVTGRHPFHVKTDRWSHYRRLHCMVEPRVSGNRAKSPGALRELTLACLSKTPASRPQTFEEVARGLASIALGEGVHHVRMTMPSRHHVRPAALRDQGWARVRLALSERDRGDYSLASRAFQEAIRRFERGGDQEGLASSLVRLGKISFNQSRFEVAGRQFSEARNIFENSGFREGVSDALVGLAAVAEVEDRFVEARSLYSKALRIRRRIGRAGRVADCLANLAILDFRAKRLASAEKRYLCSLRIYRQLRDRHSEARTLHHLGLARLGRHHLRPALSASRRAGRLLEDLGDRHSLADALGGEGMILLAMQRIGPARAKLQTSLRLMVELGDLSGQARCHHQLALSMRRRDGGMALMHFRRAHALLTKCSAARDLSELLPDFIKECESQGNRDEARSLRKDLRGLGRGIQ